MPDATFDADVTIPPDAVFPPGVRMDKVWQVRNSGSCAWGVGYELVQTAGQDLSAPAAVPVPNTAAGDMADLAITLWAPLGSGTYTSVWQLRSPDGDLFGPALPLTISVEALAQESAPPAAPTDLQATVVEDGSLVRLTWSDRSDNEDAFRIYRSDVEASIALAPANAEQFVDKGVVCGNTYRYLIMAFNAAGSSAISATAEAALPPCAPANVPPTLTLTVVPTQVQASETFTIVFQADDDLGLDLVVVWGEDLYLYRDPVRGKLAGDVDARSQCHPQLVGCGPRLVRPRVRAGTNNCGHLSPRVHAYLHRYAYLHHPAGDTLRSLLAPVVPRFSGYGVSSKPTLA
ncbi:NBR1-Ig-like domain-containing protein [Chloroflexota bacterium]